MIIFYDEYDGESISDLERDIMESLDEQFNPFMKDIPHDKDGFMKGTFQITIEWKE